MKLYRHVSIGVSDFLYKMYKQIRLVSLPALPEHGSIAEQTPNKATPNLILEYSPQIKLVMQNRLYVQKSERKSNHSCKRRYGDVLVQKCFDSCTTEPTRRTGLDDERPYRTSPTILKYPPLAFPHQVSSVVFSLLVQKKLRYYNIIFQSTRSERAEDLPYCIRFCMRFTS